jgi:hypothetical protein
MSGPSQAPGRTDRRGLVSRQGPHRASGPEPSTMGSKGKRPAAHAMSSPRRSARWVWTASRNAAEKLGSGGLLGSASMRRAVASTRD